MRNIQKKIAHMLVVAGMLIAVLACSSGAVFAQDTQKKNSETGYKAIIEDDGSALSSDEIDKLLDAMYPVTEYGNVAFKTIDYNNYYSTREYAENYCYSSFGNESSVVFLVDFDNREIYMAADGEIYKTITSSVATTITDNTYEYATDGDYYGCAKEAFSEVCMKLDGQSIAQPMKHINNILIAIIIAMLVNFTIVSRKARLRSAKAQKILESAEVSNFEYTEPKAEFIRTSRVFSPIDTGGGGGPHGGGGGEGGGGGFSGGGGGHKF